MTDLPTVLDEATQPAIERLHHLLVRADSRLPDELVVTARAWLAEGLVLDVAEAVVFSCLSCDVPLLPADAELLGDILRNAGADAAAVAGLPRSEKDDVPACRLAGRGLPATAGRAGRRDHHPGRDPARVAGHRRRRQRHRARVTGPGVGGRQRRAAGMAAVRVAAALPAGAGRG